MSVDREYGSISYSQSEGSTVYTITLEANVAEDPDQMDRILQSVMFETGVDTSWQVPPPDPDPDEHPPVIPDAESQDSPNPPNPDPLPEGPPEGVTVP